MAVRITNLTKLTSFSQAPEEIKDILNDVERDGIAVRWWNLVDDMVLFYEDEESLRLAPHGIVMYSKRELDLLFGEAGPTPGHMRLIHEAKEREQGSLNMDNALDWRVG